VALTQLLYSECEKILKLCGEPHEFQMTVLSFYRNGKQE